MHGLRSEPFISREKISDRHDRVRRPSSGIRWLWAVGVALAAIVIVGSQLGDRESGNPPPTTRSSTTTDDLDSSGSASRDASTGAVDLTGRVTRVIDGDTIRVESRGFETTVRLIGIDAPETRKPGTPVQCFGPEASRRAQALLSGKRVRLIGDPTQDTRDRFQRLLAYVYVDGETQSVNSQLVDGGFAKVYVYGPSGPFRHTTAFRAAESRARQARRGLWGAACNRSAPSPRQ